MTLCEAYEKWKAIQVATTAEPRRPRDPSPESDAALGGSGATLWVFVSAAGSTPDSIDFDLGFEAARRAR